MPMAEPWKLQFTIARGVEILEKITLQIPKIWNDLPVEKRGQVAEQILKALGFRATMTKQQLDQHMWKPDPNPTIAQLEDLYYENLSIPMWYTMLEVFDVLGLEFPELEELNPNAFTETDKIVRVLAKSLTAERFSYLTEEENPIYIPINRIKTPYQTEKAVNPSKIISIASSIRQGETLPPLIIGYDYDLHDGHHRLLASEKLGLTHVPCVVGGIDEAKVQQAEREYRSLFKGIGEDMLKKYPGGRWVTMRGRAVYIKKDGTPAEETKPESLPDLKAELTELALNSTDEYDFFSSVSERYSERWDEVKQLVNGSVDEIMGFWKETTKDGTDLKVSKYAEVLGTYKDYKIKPLEQVPQSMPVVFQQPDSAVGYHNRRITLVLPEDLDTPEGLRSLERSIAREMGRATIELHSDFAEQLRYDNFGGVLGRQNVQTNKFEDVFGGDSRIGSVWMSAYVKYHSDPESLKKDYPEVHAMVEHILGQVPYIKELHETAFTNAKREAKVQMFNNIRIPGNRYAQASLYSAIVLHKDKQEALDILTKRVPEGIAQHILDEWEPHFADSTWVFVDSKEIFKQIKDEFRALKGESKGLNYDVESFDEMFQDIFLTDSKAPAWDTAPFTNMAKEMRKFLGEYTAEENINAEFVKDLLSKFDYHEQDNSWDDIRRIKATYGLRQLYAELSADKFDISSHVDLDYHVVAYHGTALVNAEKILYDGFRLNGGSDDFGNCAYFKSFDYDDKEESHRYGTVEVVDSFNRGAVLEVGIAKDAKVLDCSEDGRPLDLVELLRVVNAPTGGNSHELAYKYLIEFLSDKKFETTEEAKAHYLSLPREERGPLARYINGTTGEMRRILPSPYEIYAFKHKYDVIVDTLDRYLGEGWQLGVYNPSKLVVQNLWRGFEYDPHSDSFDLTKSANKGDLPYCLLGFEKKKGVYTMRVGAHTDQNSPIEKSVKDDDNSELKRKLMSNVRHRYRARLRYKPDGKPFTRAQLQTLEYILRKYQVDPEVFGESMAVRATVIGKIIAEGDKRNKKLLLNLVEELPTRIEQVRVPFRLTLKDGSVLPVLPLQAQEINAIEWASQFAGEHIRSTQEDLISGVKLLVAQARRERWEPQRLEQALFDKFGQYNRDWRRIALTELAEATNNGYLMTLKDGEAVIGQSAVDRCEACLKLVDKKIYTFRKDPGDPDTEIWVGKSNAGLKRRDWKPAVIIHPHCLTAGHKVSILGGTRNIEDVKSGDLVLTHEGRYQPVTGTSRRDYKGVILTVTTEQGTLEITPNHQVLTDRGWIEAGLLQEGDNIVHIP